MSTKSPKKILILSSFPVVQARHGGQKRVQAVISEYKQHFAQVKSVAVFSRWANPRHGPDDIPVSHATDRLIQESGRLEDILCGEAIFSEPQVKRHLANVLRQFRPDVIQVEQIYPYIGLAPLLDELGLKTQLVYDAHNIEYEMKQAIYQTSPVSSAEAKQLVGRLESLERELASRAALTATVSPADRDVFQALGARKLVLAPNGIYPAVPAARQAAAWRRQFASDGVNHTFLYVSSAHIPNWTSFLDMVGEGLGFLLPDARILLAGGLSHWLTTRYKWQPTPGAATFWLRAEGLGILTEDRLSGLLTATDHIILPITTGGGSNLKTAEALLTGKPLIATSRAFRTYEQFTQLPTVTIADTPEDFRAAMVAALNTPVPVLTAAERAQVAATVTWPHCLEALVQEVAAL
jgi:glycosyltransferase involved in cell wall biosynthesis